MQKDRHNNAAQGQADMKGRTVKQATPPARFSSLPPVVWVGVGGSVGALTRAIFDSIAYALPIGFHHLPFMWSTVFVNLSGAFALGYLTAYVLAANEERLHPTTRHGKTRTIRNDDKWNHIKLLLGTGFFGAYTTYSTFALAHLDSPENASTLHMPSLLYVFIGLLILAVGLACAGLGFILADKLHTHTRYRRPPKEKGNYMSKRLGTTLQATGQREES
ncbi:MAG: CrcB family protein [Actinomycetaceae bacterium]|nr:CrcB family protein [Actinomycetaceae bacterium]